MLRFLHPQKRLPTTKSTAPCPGSRTPWPLSPHRNARQAAGQTSECMWTLTLKVLGFGGGTEIRETAQDHAEGSRPASPCTQVPPPARSWSSLDDLPQLHSPVCPLGPETPGLSLLRPALVCNSILITKTAVQVCLSCRGGWSQWAEAPLVGSPLPVTAPSRVAGPCLGTELSSSSRLGSWAS